MRCVSYRTELYSVKFYSANMYVAFLSYVLIFYAPQAKTRQICLGGVLYTNIGRTVYPESECFSFIFKPIRREAHVFVCIRIAFSPVVGTLHRYTPSLLSVGLYLRISNK